MSTVDRLSGWWVDRLAYARNRWRKATTERPGALATAFLEGQAQGQQFANEGLDVEAAHATATASAWVYSDIQLIANRLASTNARPMVQARIGDELEDMGNHPFELLLSSPNALMGGSFLLRYTAWWLLLSGNAYVFAGTPQVGQGEPFELWPLVASRCQPIPTTLRTDAMGRQVVDYAYSVNGVDHTLPGENVVHFRLANPFDYWRGLSPLSAALVAVESDRNRAKWDRDFFGVDNAVPTAVISLRETVGESDFLRAKEEIREEFGGRKRTAITRAGDFTVQTIQQTMAEMQLVEGREFSRREIDRVYGVPEGLISGGLSGDSRLAAETAFAANTIQPLIDYMAEEWSGLVKRYWGDDLLVTAPNIIPRDKSLAVQEYNIYSQDRTVNENRAELDLEPVADPLADVPVRLLKLRFGGDVSGPGVGALPGGQAPATAVEQEAAKWWTVDATPLLPSPNGTPPDAVLEGIRSELRRWQRVAVKEAKAGRNPAERAFETEIIPPDLAEQVREVLAQADGEDGVRLAFAGLEVPASGPFRLDWQSYP